MSTIDDQRRAAGLNARIDEIAPIDEPEAPEVVTEDATIGNEERLRGIPAVGRVSGAMKNTRPGDTVKALMDEIDELYQQAIQARKINRQRYKRPR